jgi:hypothetical protein
MIELRLPKIDALTVQGKINQIQDYLFQTIRQINLNFEDKGSNGQGEQGTGDTNKYIVKKGEDSVQGEWNPVANTGTLSGVTATYTKVGKLVFVFLSGSYTTGDEDKTLKISGLPFNVKNQAVGNFSLTTNTFYSHKSKANEYMLQNVLAVFEADYIEFSGWHLGYVGSSLTSDCISSGIFHLSAVYQTE